MPICKDRVPLSVLPWRKQPSWRVVEVLPELIGLVYEGVAEVRPWFALVERLRSLFAARNVTVTLHHWQDRIGDVHVMSLDEHDNTDWQLAERIYRQRFAHIELLRPETMSPGQLREFGPGDVEPACAEFFTVLGIGQCLRICFAESGGMRCWVDVLLGDGTPKRGFCAEERHLFLSLLPHLTRALGLYARMQRQEAHRLVYEGNLDHLQQGCLLLNGESRVITANRAVKAMLARHAGIELTKGRVQIRDRSLQQLLEQAIARAVEQRHAPGPAEPGKLLRVPGQAGVLFGMSVAPAPLLRYFQGCQAPSVILNLVELSEVTTAPQSSSYPPELIAQLFALTRQEARLASCLADGQSISEAAAQMGIAVTAARNYTKNIYAKLGIKGQTDLVRMLCKSSVLLRR
ncbi:LuxR family transcriptional regulator [Pseudomonas jessenii]|uniref:helix-turn-helix transcriptional regulator n=1 Tax=Pseudomonas jessenii TaxID=77298 RepID=UPI0039E1864C